MAHELTPAQTIEFLQRSYTSVDGLWFMICEETYDFATALELDEKVWKVFPKIQARKLKQLLNLDPQLNPALDPLDALFHCLTQKMRLDQFQFTAQRQADSFTLTITQCPWLELLRKSKREHLGGQIGRRICPAEFSAWAREFGPDIRFELASPACEGRGVCSFTYRLQRS